MSENMRVIIWMLIIVVDIYMYLDWGYNTNHRKDKKHGRRKGKGARQ